MSAYYEIVLLIMKSNIDKSWTVNEISEIAKLEYHQVYFALIRLIDKDQIIKESNRLYKIKKNAYLMID